MTKSLVLQKNFLTSDQNWQGRSLAKLTFKQIWSRGINSDGDQFSNDKSHSWCSFLTV